MLQIKLNCGCYFNERSKGLFYLKLKGWKYIKINSVHSTVTKSAENNGKMFVKDENVSVANLVRV